MARVDVQLIDGLGLPYVTGAEAALVDPQLDPVFNIAWQGFVALYPGQTLQPLFDELPIDQLADLVDSVRLNGEEPPDPFVWFTLACTDEEADAIAAALLALPMVTWAEKRRPMLRPGFVSYGTNPGPAGENNYQILLSPIGIDAIYAWQVPGGDGEGVRIVDIEDGWRLDHEELIAANINRISVFGPHTPRNVDHGTAVAGILVGADNGLGSIGIVPGARFDLVSVRRADGEQHSAQSIAVAASKLTHGDIVLIEGALSFYDLPNPEAGQPDILVEFSPPVQLQIKLATGRGITVIEPAGNGGIDLDAFPFFAHIQPGSPSFSGAIVVGSAQDRDPPRGEWTRVSTYGRRVDCFGAGSHIEAPMAGDTNLYQVFGGTSGASAIVAGVCASLQGMTKAAGRDVLAPADLRRWMMSAIHGVLPQDPLNAKVGTMPDLRRISRALGLARILPVGAAAIGGDALLIVHLDADNRIVRRHFTFFTGWGQPVPTPTADGSASVHDIYPLTPAQPSILSMNEAGPVPRLVYDAFFSGGRGIHHMWWDSNNGAGNVIDEVAPRSAAAQGHSIAAVRVRTSLVVLAAINPLGRLVALSGDSHDMRTTATPALEVDTVAMYRRLPGVAMASRDTGLLDLVAVEDGGSLNWYTGTVPEIWPILSDAITDQSGVTFDPGARPALISTGSLLLAAAVGTDGSLRVVSMDPVLRTIEAPIEIDRTVPMARSGPVALARTTHNVVVLGVDTQYTVRAATRPIAGGNWTPLFPILSLENISPLGGVTAVSIDLGVMAVAVNTDGVVCSALSGDGVLWSLMSRLP